MLRHLRELLLAALLLPLGAAAQYPAKPVHLVVPFPAGGPTDVLSRVLAQKLSERWSVAVVVDNKPGAGGAIGSDSVAKSAPDGYTLVMATSSTHSIGPALQKLPYDPLKDFTPISQTWSAPNVLLVSPKLGVHNVRELIALAKAKPGQLNFASSGIGTIPHLSAELFKRLAGIDIVHVPYKGTGLAISDIARGQVAMIFDSIITGQQHAKAGNVRMLAVSTAKRSALLPDVPTMAEAGVPGYESNTYFGVLGPAGLPREVVDKLSGDIAAVLKAEDLRARFAAAGAEPAGTAPEAFAALIESERDKWARLIRSANIKVE
jgi:tripartite-type tricarboxylate transporter receptor subunit TctC